MKEETEEKEKILCIISLLLICLTLLYLSSCSLLITKAEQDCERITEDIIIEEIYRAKTGGPVTIPAIP